MDFLGILKAEWIVAGLKAPIFSWVASVFLVVLPMTLLLRIAVKSWREASNFRLLSQEIGDLQKQYADRSGKGLSMAAFDAIKRAFEPFPQYSHCWNNFRSRVVRQANDQGEDEFWSSDGSDTAFSEYLLLDLPFKRPAVAAVPSIVTGLGLFFTFLAILVALVDVRIVNNKFEGMDTLIEGLSGKFVSSVAALASATLFVIFEKPLFFRLVSSRRRLVDAIDSYVPRLTAPQILSRIHNDIAEQTNAFRLFNTDLSLKLKQSFSESIGPTLERMVDSVEQLNAFLQEAEKKRSDDLVSQVEGVLVRIEQSITATFDSLGKTFSQSLTGSAKEQFETVVKVLGDSAMLLDGMNLQFTKTQANLGSLIDLVKTSTAEQVAHGQSHVEALTSVLKELMGQLKETASSSSQQMSAALAAMLADISQRLSALASDVSETVSRASNSTTETAQSVIKKAEEWTRANSERLNHIIEKYETQIELTSDLNETLKSTLIGFKDSLTKYGTVTDDLKGVSSEVNASVSLMKQILGQVQDNHNALKSVASLTLEQIETLKESSAAQKQMWQEVSSAMQQYRATFAHVEDAAKNLIAQISDDLRRYVELTEDNFKNLVKVSDEHFANAYKRLGDGVNELDEVLQDLTETITRARR